MHNTVYMHEQFGIPALADLGNNVKSQMLCSFMVTLSLLGHCSRHLGLAGTVGLDLGSF